MADKTWFFLAIFACIFLPFAFAQAGEPAGDETAAEELNYFIDRSEGEPRFIQRLIWEETNYVLRYEVVVQRRENNGSYREVERRRTENNFAEISLFAGRYRYQVRVYDLFDELSLTTDWREFEIIRALQPELSGFSPSAFYLDEDMAWEITLRGRNLIPESEIYLVNKDRKIRPQSSVSDGNSSRLVFSGISLASGQYDVYVRNPGGLDTRLGTFTITNKKPFDLLLALGYAPIIPLYGYWFDDSDVDAPFPDSFYPLGAAAKISFLPIKRAWGNLGIEASISMSYMKYEHRYYSPSIFLWNTQFSLLYQKYLFKKKFAFNVNLGGGAAIMQGFQYEYPVGSSYNVPLNIVPSAIFGLSGMVFINKAFFVSAGADFIHVFSAETPAPGYIRPFLMGGIRL